MVRTMLRVMDDWKSIIVALGGTGAVAGALNQSDSTVSGWQSPERRGIPASHWAALVALAAARGVSGVTLEVLADLAAREVVEARA
jgi:hypothetical protein